MRKVIEYSADRFSEKAGFYDMALFYDCAFSKKWKGRLAYEDMAAYANRIAELLPPEDIASLETGMGDPLRPA